MNKTIYDNNMKSIRNKYENWANFIEEKKYVVNPRIRVDTEKALTGEPLFRVSYNGKILYLNGKYKPSFSGRDWLNSVKTIDDFSTVVIIGIHDAIHIRNILKEVKPTTNILIYEPSIEIFLKTLEEIDVRFLFEKDIPIGLIIDGINEKEQSIFLNSMISYDNMTKLKVYLSGNYDKLFFEKIKTFVDALKKYVLDIQKNWNTG